MASASAGRPGKASPAAGALRILRSTSVRLALGYAGLFIASSLLLGGLLWWLTAGYLDREIEAVILSDTRAVSDSLRDFGLAGAVDTVRERIGRYGDQNAIYLLTGPTLAPVAGNLDGWPVQAGRAAGWYQADMVRGGTVHATRLLHIALPGGFHLLVGRDVQELIELRAVILEALAIAAAAALLLGILGAFLVRRAAQRRVEAINRTAAAIVQGDLAQRLPTRESADEFDQLADTVNRMLEQIEQLVEGVRNVSNAIAHDLRTPLAEVRVRLEEVLRNRPPQEATFEAIDETLQEIDRVMAMFNALLRLAEIDSGVRRSGFRPVDLASVVEEVVELYGPTAEAGQITLAVEDEPGLMVQGDPFLLAQALGNLLDNAVKFSPLGGRVLLSLARRADDRILVTVADQGPGIPDCEKERVAERFFRGDASRGTAGFGLGLSVVASVARLHGGSLVLADAAPGLVASLALPAAPPAG